MSQQRSGGEPTEQPTPKKLRESRLKGQIPRSAEMSGFVVFAAAAGALLITGAGLASTLAQFTRECIRGAPHYAPEAAWAVLRESVWTLALTVGPILAAAVVAAVLVGGLQAGGLWTWKPLQPQLKRLDPLQGLKQLVSLRKVVDLARLLVGIAALAAVVWMTLDEALGALLRLSGARPAVIAGEILRLSTTLAWRGGLVLAMAAAVDYAIQRHRHSKDLMMTKEEVKREHKETEGDPQHRAARKRLHREIVEHDMIEQVRQADFVVANPTHIAVALRYDASRSGSAPEVVARGHRLVAERIKQVARQAGVPIVHDVPLARALADLSPGDEIPEALYKAVAALLRALREESEEPEEPDHADR
jgi:type III secretion protein U